MKRNNRFVRKAFCYIRWQVIFGALMLVALFLAAKPADAITFDVGGRPLNFMGYLNQGVAYGLGDDDFDSMSGLQQAIFQCLLEMEYLPTNQLRLFASFSLNADWAYQIHDGDDEWEDKGFDQSKDRLSFFDEGRDILKELHATISIGDFYFRVGKQIVVWGEMDFLRVMDMINPRDSRRGQTDVEFETTIMPIWLVKAEYQPGLTLGFMEQIGIQFLFNPNADFEGNADRGIRLGNDEGGIWSPNVMAGPAHLGSFNETLEDIDNFDSEGYEYGIRLNCYINDGYFTLNYFNGLENVPQTIVVGAPGMEISPWDGLPILHLPTWGFFPDLEFLGITYSSDVPFLKSRVLGGVSPVIRFEGQYIFDRTFVNAFNTFEEQDEIRLALGVDWKFRFNLLNNRNFFTLSPQFIWEHIPDFPSTGLTHAGYTQRENMYTSSLVLATKYFHSKIRPQLAWMRTYKGDTQGDMILASCLYEYSSNWNFQLGSIFFHNEGFTTLNNKDQIYFTVSYRWF